MGTTNQAPINPYQNAQAVSFDFWDGPVLKAADGSYYVPGVEGATYATRSWDRVVIAGYPYNPPLEQNMTPGICTVDVKKNRDVDKKKAASTDGARITIHGLEPADVDIRLTIWTPEQLRRLKDLWAFLFPRFQKGQPAAYDVQHPVFTHHDVKAIQFVKGEGPTVNRDRTATFIMHAIEFLPPGKKNAAKTNVSALGSKLDPSTTTNPTPGSNPKNTGPA